MAEHEPATTTADVDVHRHSWWKTPDGERLLVVVGIYHARGGQSLQPTSYEVLEVPEQGTKQVGAGVFRELVQDGRLVRVVRKKDVPRPPSIF